tara:strand:+ start:41 stop:535 length:495 start_codon:yes stop_codon:yes gene_type:complete
MILIEDSITDGLYQNCVKELNEKLSENCWKSSSLNWGSDVKQGVDGSCIITPVSDTIHNLLEQELKSSLPKHRELEFNYYIWQPQSGISWHNDKAPNRSFGASLYLNEEWYPNNGGWFIWEDEEGHHTILPKKKFLVINNNYQHHCVTPVSLGFRCTIQIWGLL